MNNSGGSDLFERELTAVIISVGSPLVKKLVDTIAARNQVAVVDPATPPEPIKIELPPPPPPPKPRNKRPRKLNVEARRKIAEAQRRRWARKKQADQTDTSEP